MLFAKWLAVEPRVLIADEPTRGVDVAAKQQIYALIAELAAGGMAVLLISSEIEEVLGLSHRDPVMRRGSRGRGARWRRGHAGERDARGVRRGESRGGAVR